MKLIRVYFQEQGLMNVYYCTFESEEEIRLFFRQFPQYQEVDRKEIRR